MKIKDLQEAPELSRRGFLRGIGTAAVAGAVPGLAMAKKVDRDAIAKQIQNIFVKNLKLTKIPQPTSDGKYKFVFNDQGNLLKKEQIESCGDEQLDIAILNSATNIPLSLVSEWGNESQKVAISFGVSNGWYKQGIMQPSKDAQATSDKESNDDGNVIGKIKKSIDIFLKGRPNSVINEINFVSYDNVELIYAFGDFGENDFFAGVSPTGLELKGLLSGVGPLRNLSTKWAPLFGSTTTRNIFLSSLDSKKNVTQEKFFVDPNTKKLSKTETVSTNLSKFSIKGLRFGMTKEQVKNIKNKNGIGAGVLSAISAVAGTGTEAVDFGSLLNVRSQPDPTSKEFGAEMAYAGMPGWLQYKDNKLVAIVLINKSDVISELCQRLMEVFPGGESASQSWQNRMGNTFPNKIYKWAEVDGASILAKVRDSKVNEGSITFADTNEIKSNSNLANLEKEKQNSKKDF